MLSWLRKSASFLINVVLISTVFSDSSFRMTNAWGPEGHTAVARIAEKHITATTFNAVSQMIPEGDIASVANWADQVRSIPAWHWSEPLHFIDTPSWVCDYEPSRDCYNDAGEFGYCVDGAIRNFTSLIKGGSRDPTNLKFLVHFVGDIHQPLHCGFKDDRGGNSIKVHYQGHATNLHSLWDSGLIHTRIANDFGGVTENWISNLVEMSLGRNDTDNCVGCSSQWGNSSAILSCSHSYVGADGTTRIGQGASLDSTYYKRNIGLIEDVIILGGIRLADILDSLFAV